MVEFALVAPVFLLVVFATIDYGGYFGTRLSVENAARAGARTAVVEAYSSSFSTQGSAIVTSITSHSNVELVPNDVDCTWNGTTLTPTVYPPFTMPAGQNACIGVWYFELTTTGAPFLCAQWSVASSAWSWWDSSGQSAVSKDTNCVSANQDIVVVGVGYRYSPFTPLPSIANGALTTFGETQLVEEQ
jgi:hypothetical protein